MSFFSSLHRRASTSVLLIDVGSASVAGAYIRVDAKKNATIYFTARIPLRTRNSKDVLIDMEHALAELTDILLRDGAPAFSHAVGNGKIDKIVVSVSSPWQETKVRVERVSHKKPFRFTPSVMNEMVSTNTDNARTGYICTNNLVASTILNGYEIAHPFGRIVHDVSVVVLSSSIPCDVIDKISTALRKTFHTHEINFTAFAPVAYLALRDIYPHQKDFLIMDVTGEATDFVLIQQGILVETVSIPYGLNFLRRAAIDAGIDTSTAEPLRAVEEAILVDVQNNKRFTIQAKKACETWIKEITGALQSITTHYALPHATFLLVDETARNFIKKLLDETDFHLGDVIDESLSVVLIDPGKFANRVVHRDAALGDTFLSILALYVAREYPIPSASDSVHLLTSSA